MAMATVVKDGNAGHLRTTGMVAAMLLLLSPGLSAQSLNFPEEEIQVYPEQDDAEYTRQDGTGESTETAPVFYIPVASTTNGSYQTIENLSTSLIAGSEARSRLSIPVEISIGGDGSWDAFVAAKKTSSEQYQVIHNLPNVKNGQSVTLTPDLKDICDEDNDLDWDCSKFQRGEGGREEIILFIGVGIQGEVDHAPAADSVDPGNYEKGRYVRLKLNSIVATEAPTLNSLHKGEGRLRVGFGEMEVEEPEGLYAYVRDHGTSNSDESCQSRERAAPSTYGTLSGKGTHTKIGPGAAGGKSAVKDLLNGHCYSIQLYYRDKYGFASGVSEGRSASPESLEKLLEKNSCFLLTAGFGGDHPIIDDFRHFRDHQLRHSSLGRAFIRHYYRHAPALAPMVARSPLLSGLIQWMARMFHRLFLRKQPLDTVSWPRSLPPLVF